jgi:hypothetical protein
MFSEGLAQQNNLGNLACRLPYVSQKLSWNGQEVTLVSKPHI